MSLAKHCNPDELIAKLWEHPPHHRARAYENATHHTSYVYGTRYAADVRIPKFKIPADGTPAASVHQLIKDELDLDGRPNLNLASFVNTYMEPEADKLMMDNISKNLADSDEYPAVQAIHTRCISMIANLWNAPKGSEAVGTATTGSSEGIHLGGLAMKRRWQKFRKDAGKSTEKPNIIMGANAQVALEKFARYFEVEARILPVTPESHYCLSASAVRENIDENTIGIFVILGSTYTGHYEPVEEISQVLDDYQKVTGHDIPIHVDAASGGFVAPFANYSKKWGFDLDRVRSISASGHKYGLVYPGIGWVLWRSADYLPKELIFELHYLGGTEQTYTLNFSRPAAHVVGQYFNFLTLGTEGYRRIMHNALHNARLLSKALEASDWYDCVSDIHRQHGTFTRSAHPAPDSTDPAKYNAGLPVVAFKLTDDFKASYPHVSQQSIATLLRSRGYIIPNYPLPPSCGATEILRVVVRESMNADLLDMLIHDILETTQTLMQGEHGEALAFVAQPKKRLEKEVGSLGRTHRHGRKVVVGDSETGDRGVLKTTC